MENYSHTTPPVAPGRQGQPFAPGDVVLVLDPATDRIYEVRLKPGATFQTQKSGLVAHDVIIGLRDGARVATNRQGQFICLRPTLEDHLLRLPRQTQILFAKDLGLILLKANLHPGAKILEAGIGSGSLATTLLHHLGPAGHLISYEIREEFAKLALRNLEAARERLGSSGARHTLRLHNIYDGIVDDDLDTIFLDVPEPARVLPHAVKALRPGGVFLAWLPTALQVYELVRALQRDTHFTYVETTETLQRPWDVGPNSVRPAHRMVAHTGFLIRARRVDPAPAPNPETAGE